MRLKLDENLGSRLVEFFLKAGHDVETVVTENMMGASDVALLAACVAEHRALVTLDLDFANPLRFDPRPTAGIAVMRVPNLPEHADLVHAAEALIARLGHSAITGHLWVVGGDRVREYRREDE